MLILYLLSFLLSFIVVAYILKPFFEDSYYVRSITELISKSESIESMHALEEGENNDRKSKIFEDARIDYQLSKISKDEYDKIINSLN